MPDQDYRALEKYFSAFHAEGEVLDSYNVEFQSEFGICLVIALSFLCLIGNLSVCKIIYLQKKWRKDHILFFNLAVVDLLVMLTTYMALIISFSNGSSWNLGNNLCKFFRFTQVLVNACSTYTLTLLAVLQFFSLYKPCLVELRPWTWVLMTWLLSLLPALPQVYVSEVKEYSALVSLCKVYYRPELISNYRLIYFVLRNTFLIFLPFVACAISFSVIFLKKGLWRSLSESARKLRIFDTTLAMSTVFAVTSLPYAFESMRLVLSKSGGMMSDEDFYFTVIYISKSVINPFIYLVLLRNDPVEEQASVFMYLDQEPPKENLHVVCNKNSDDVTENEDCVKSNLI